MLPEAELDRRGARLGEEQADQVDQAVPDLAGRGIVPRQELVADQGETLRSQMRRGEDPAIRPLGQRRVELGVLASEHGKSHGLPAQQLGGLRGIGGAIFEADDIGELRQAQEGLVGRVDPGAVGDVVDQDRPVGRLSERGEMAIEPLLGRPDIVGGRR